MMIEKMVETALDFPVAEKIRLAILEGKWPAGYRLAPALLAEEFETSTTVVREALIRLAGERLVLSKVNRGFFVPELDIREFKDITELRCLTETFALRLSIERGGMDWETSLLASHHRLLRTPRRLESEPTRISSDWQSAHRSFHLALIGGCACEPILKVAHNLSLATDWYRRWAAPSTSAAKRNVEKEHQDLTDAALARDSERATTLLRSHYELTSKVVIKAGLSNLS